MAVSDAALAELAAGLAKPKGGGNPFGPRKLKAPFVCLGVSGGVYYALDVLFQLRELGLRDISYFGLVALTGGREEWWLQHFGVSGKPPPKPRPKPKLATNDGEPVAEDQPPPLPPLRKISLRKAGSRFVEGCQAEGLFDVWRRVRGRGAWRGRENDLMLNLGDGLWKPGRNAAGPLGRYGHHVYIADMPLRAPAEQRQAGGDDGPAAHVLEALRQWSWRDQQGPRLMLGWTAHAFVASALPVCAHVQIPGDFGTGKTALLSAVGTVTGGWMARTVDPREASIRAMLGFGRTAVAVDEGEASQHASDVIALARMSAHEAGAIPRALPSGQLATMRTIHNAFLFSAIVPPSLAPADRGRMAILDLDPLERPDRLPQMRRLGPLGRALHRRIVDRYELLLEEIEPAFRAGLVGDGWNGRAADTFAAIWAAGWAVLRDGVPDAGDVEEAVELLGPHGERLKDEAPNSWQSCRAYWFSLHIDPRAVERRTIGWHVRRMAGYGEDGYGARDELQAREHSRGAPALESAAKLRAIGIRIWQDQDGTRWLAVARDHPELNRLLIGTRWDHGGYQHALRRAPDAVSAPRHLRFAGPRLPAIIIPLAVALDGMVGPDFAESDLPPGVML